MPSAYTRPQRHLTAIATVFVLASVAFPAVAGSKAPIVYANETTAAPATASRSTATTGTLDKASQRIEFRYPGSSTPAGRVEMASVSAPQVLSPMAEQGLADAPQFAASKVPFDAAGTAAMIGTSSLGPVVTTAMPEPVALKAASPQPKLANTEVAVVYGDEFEGLPTANGEIFDQLSLTAAHPSLPLPSLVAVTNPANGREVVVRVNDRGPFEDGASLQVSRQVARELGFEAAGKAALTMRLVGNAPAAVAEIKTPVVAEPKLLRAAASLPAQQSSEELYGDDELAGGATWTPAPAKARAEVKWPEPPADWDVAPAKATKVAAQKVTAAPSGTMYVQLASFSDIGNAEALYSGLKGDLPVEIVPARVNGTDYFRVRVGPLASRTDAQELRDRLNAEGKGDGRVVSAE